MGLAGVESPAEALACPAGSRLCPGAAAERRSLHGPGPRDGPGGGAVKRREKEIEWSLREGAKEEGQGAESCAAEPERRRRRRAARPTSRKTRAPGPPARAAVSAAGARARRAAFDPWARVQDPGSL